MPTRRHGGDIGRERHRVEPPLSFENKGEMSKDRSKIICKGGKVGVRGMGMSDQGKSVKDGGSRLVPLWSLDYWGMGVSKCCRECVGEGQEPWVRSMHSALIGEGS
jgi:hypothetical protein